MTRGRNTSETFGEGLARRLVERYGDGIRPEDIRPVRPEKPKREEDWPRQADVSREAVFPVYVYEDVAMLDIPVEDPHEPDGNVFLTVEQMRGLIRELGWAIDRLESRA